MIKDKLHAMSIQQMNTEEMKTKNGGFLITGTTICLIVATILGISGVVMDTKQT